MKPGPTHLPVASMTRPHPDSSRSSGVTAATRPSRRPMLRIAEGPPVPSNQRPLRMVVSKLMPTPSLVVGAPDHTPHRTWMVDTYRKVFTTAHGYSDRW